MTTKGDCRIKITRNLLGMRLRGNRAEKMTFWKSYSVISLSAVFARYVYKMLVGEIADPQSLGVHILSTSIALLFFFFFGRIQTYILVTNWRMDAGLSNKWYKLLVCSIWTKEMKKTSDKSLSLLKSQRHFRSHLASMPYSFLLSLSSGALLVQLLSFSATLNILLILQLAFYL